MQGFLLKEWSMRCATNVNFSLFQLEPFGFFAVAERKPIVKKNQCEIHFVRFLFTCRQFECIKWYKQFVRRKVISAEFELHLSFNQFIILTANPFTLPTENYNLVLFLKFWSVPAREQRKNSSLVAEFSIRSFVLVPKLKNGWIDV